MEGFVITNAGELLHNHVERASWELFQRLTPQSA